MLRRSICQFFFFSSNKSNKKQQDPRNLYGGHLPRFHAHRHPTGRDYQGGFSYFGDGSNASSNTSRQIYQESSGIVMAIKNCAVIALCCYMFAGMLEFMNDVNEHHRGVGQYHETDAVFPRVWGSTIDSTKGGEGKIFCSLTGG